MYPSLTVPDLSFFTRIHSAAILTTNEFAHSAHTSAKKLPGTTIGAGSIRRRMSLSSKFGSNASTHVACIVVKQNAHVFIAMSDGGSSQSKQHDIVVAVVVTVVDTSFELDEDDNAKLG